MIWEEQTNRDCNVHTICMNKMNGYSIQNEVQGVGQLGRCIKSIVNFNVASYCHLRLKKQNNTMVDVYIYMIPTWVF